MHTHLSQFVQIYGRIYSYFNKGSASGKPSILPIRDQIRVIVQPLRTRSPILAIDLASR